MQTQDINSLITQAETETSAASKTATSKLGKESFLNLLVTQLKYQDPLNPQADTEFIAQLAQFSSLEQLTNISAGIEEMQNLYGQQSMLNAVSFIGKEVLASGSSVSKEGTQVSTIKYSIEDTAANIYANIYDANGNVVQTMEIGAKQAGTYELSWDGKDYTGATVADGVYYIAVAAEGENGEAVFASTEVSGTVSGVSVVNGETYLSLKDGRQVKLSNIKEIVNPATT